MTTLGATTGLFGGIGSWLARLLRPESPTAPEPLRGMHRLDRILIVLARGSADLEPRRLLVGHLGVGEAEFRTHDAMIPGEKLQLQLLLETAEGALVVSGVVTGPGRLAFEADAPAAARLEAWIRKRSSL